MDTATAISTMTMTAQLLNQQQDTNTNDSFNSSNNKQHDNKFNAIKNECDLFLQNCFFITNNNEQQQQQQQQQNEREEKENFVYHIQGPKQSGKTSLAFHFAYTAAAAAATAAAASETEAAKKPTTVSEGYDNNIDNENINNESGKFHGNDDHSIIFIRPAVQNQQSSLSFPLFCRMCNANSWSSESCAAPLQPPNNYYWDKELLSRIQIWHVSTLQEVLNLVMKNPPTTSSITIVLDDLDILVSSSCTNTAQQELSSHHYYLMMQTVAILVDTCHVYNNKITKTTSYKSRLIVTTTAETSSSFASFPFSFASNTNGHNNSTNDTKNNCQVCDFIAIGGRCCCVTLGRKRTPTKNIKTNNNNNNASFENNCWAAVVRGTSRNDAVNNSNNQKLIITMDNFWLYYMRNGCFFARRTNLE